MIDEQCEQNDNLDRIWAYLKLQQFARNQLMDKRDDVDTISVNDDDEGPSPLSLALQYQFVTPWSSMIVVKHKPMQDCIVKDEKHSYPTASGYSEHTLNEDAAIAYGRNLMDLTDCAADRAIRDLAMTQDVASDTCALLFDQTEQISRIDNCLCDVDDEISRGTRVIKRIGRRIIADKYILCLLFLILLAVITIIIGIMVKS